MRAALAVLTLLAVPDGAVQAPPQASSPAPIEVFILAAGSDAGEADRALERLASAWKDSYTPILIDLARFLPRAQRFSSGTETLAVDPEAGLPQQFPAANAPVPPGARARARIIRFLERQTGQRFGDDLGRWREWMWALPYDPHPDYARFKGELYARVDPRMRGFFPAGVRADIRLDEIDWGGVGVNGIPPLVQPTAIPAADATYLDDDHIVFGVVVNGAARAYPRRILAWHEMARDTLGGVDLAVVYCTLCGTVIPYESRVGGRTVTLGTSGLLYRSNKLMFDEETGTLWATLTGRPAVGPLVGTDLRLTAHPVVTTTWGEWRREHPGTTVLSIETGHDRDYREGAAYRDYFATDRLMFRVPRVDRRLKNKDEVLGLLVPARGGGMQAAAFDVRMLASRRRFEVEIEGQTFVIETSEKGANRVYDASGERVTAFRAFWFGWYAQFPETLLFK